MRYLIALLAMIWAIPATAQDGDRQAIIEVVERFLEAINTNDADAYAALQLDDGMTYAQIYGEDGQPTLRPRSNAEWVDLIRGDTAIYEERYWNPTILIHRDIAVFWAPYSFNEDGERAHCGVDVFDLVRVNGEWRIANSMWTIEPDGCAENNPQSEMVHKPSENFLKKMVEKEHFSGAALVMRGDRVVHARAYGDANESTPNRLDTAFHVGSVTKQFTAAAIMQLVEQDLVDLDTSINTYLPARYQSPNWKSVLVHHLLAHTSGIEDYALTRDYYVVTDGWAFGTTVDGMIREAMAKELEFKPDTDHKYSNIGYTLLGEIVEERSGLPFAEYVKTNLLDPIGMTNSRIHTADHVPSKNEALGMRWNEEQSRHTKDMVVTLPVTPPDGGLITTLSDFLKWIAVYRDMKHPRLSGASLKRMIQPSIPSGSYDWPEEGLDGEASYGFGITPSGNLIMHMGFIVGYRSAFIYDRADDMLIVIFTNNTTNDSFKIAAGLYRLHDQVTDMSEVK